MDSESSKVAVAQVEREFMLERQQIGIAKAKAAGKYKGRKPTARLKAKDARKLYSEGEKPAEIARMLGIGRTSVYRALEAGHQMNKILGTLFVGLIALGMDCYKIVRAAW